MTSRHDPDLPWETSQRRDDARHGDVEWWRDAVCYQVYLRSFADGNGDGVGDLAGLRRRLPYLSELGVDAVWVNPWYPSPMADGGYDVTDYRAIDPTFGSLPEARSTWCPITPPRSTPGSARRWPAVPAAWGGTVSSSGRASGQMVTCRPTTGGVFSAVRRGPGSSNPTACPGSGTCICSRLSSPISTGTMPRFESALRFWFDHGVDGIRIGVAHAVIKAPGLPDLGPADIELIGSAAHPGPPHWDREGIHDIFRDWRALADSYAEPRVFVAEACARNPERLSRYARPGELHTAFNFDYLTTPWRAAHMRTAIDKSLTTTGAVGAPATWVLSNHDVVRHLTRYGRPQSDGPVHELADHLLAGPFDVDLGTRRARAAALLTLALPGCAYLYQGEELGLWEVEDLPDEALQDPHLAALGAYQPRSRRLPCADALVRQHPTLRLQSRPRRVSPVAASAAGMEASHRASAAR